MVLLTVFTPTYNRAHTLPEAYCSLKAQTSKNFLWLIVDDGSTDRTAALVSAWMQAEKAFAIRYLYRPNGGMHAAHNTAYAHIETELNLCLDSDDRLAKDAVEQIEKRWAQVKSKNYAGLIGLDDDGNGKLIGTGFPPGLTETTLSGYYAGGGKGDKKLVYRTDITRKYPPYPEFPNEKYVALAAKYRLIDRDYKLAVLNRVLCHVTYLEDGSSHTMWKQYAKNPRGFLYWRQLCLTYPAAATRTVLDSIHYDAACFLAKEPALIRRLCACGCKGESTMPEVSIILPVYNEERHLQKTLSALCTQTFRDFELLAVDDGSTDESRRILERFAAADARITVLAQHHGGVSRARNLALEAAKGKWVWFVDSDDLPFLNYLEKALHEPQSNDADILMGSYLKMDLNGEITRITLPKYGLIDSETLPVCFMQAQYETGYFGYLWNKLLRREKILSVDAAFDESMTLAEDLQFLVQLYRANSRVLLTPHCAMQYAAHPLRREADHFKQLLLQKEIAHWVITEQKHTEFKPFFRKKLSAYTAFSVFYAPDIGLDPITKAKEIMEDEAFCALLSEAELHGVFRCIVHCLKQQNLPALQLHLAAYRAAKHVKSILKGENTRALHSA